MFRVAQFVTLVAISSLCMAQSGPLGRAIRATQVTVDPKSLSVCSNGILQASLAQLDRVLLSNSVDLAQAESLLAVVKARDTKIVKGDTAVPEGAVVEDPSDTFTVFFNAESDTNLLSNTSMTPGTVMPWPTDTAPAGWLVCDGSAFVTNAPYHQLFETIGWRYSTNTVSGSFNVPDYRGLVLRGVDTAGTVDLGASNRVVSGVGGLAAAAGSFQAGTVCVSNSNTEARIPNRYVTWIIKYSYTPVFFTADLYTINAATVSVTAASGALTIRAPQQFITYVSNNIPTDSWRVSSMSIPANGEYYSAGSPAPTSTTNRTIMVYRRVGSTSTDSAVWEAYVGPNTSSYRAVASGYREVNSANIPFLSMIFDVPAGYVFFMHTLYNTTTDSGGYCVGTTIWKP